MEDVNQSFQQPETVKKLSRKRFIIFSGVFLSMVVVAVLGFSIFAKTRLYRSYVGWENSYLDNFRGGTTPQEAYEGFMGALEENNITRAAQYFFYKQDRERVYKKFNEIKEKKDLVDWIKERPNWSEMREADISYLNYVNSDLKKGKGYEYTIRIDRDFTFYDDRINKERTITKGEHTGLIVLVPNSKSRWLIVFDTFMIISS